MSVLTFCHQNWAFSEFKLTPHTPPSCKKQLLFWPHRITLGSWSSARGWEPAFWFCLKIASASQNVFQGRQEQSHMLSALKCTTGKDTEEKAQKAVEWVKQPLICCHLPVFTREQGWSYLFQAQHEERSLHMKVLTSRTCQESQVQTVSC